MSLDFGPNGHAVSELLAKMKTYRWFTKLGRPGRSDGDVRRVDFAWMAQHGGFDFRPWGRTLARWEQPTDDLIYSSARLDAQAAILRAFAAESVVPLPTLDEFFLDLDERFSSGDGYAPDTTMYPHEIVELPSRLLRRAALEVAVADLDDAPIHFQSLLPWLAEGYWPAGWLGQWPEGQLVVW